MARQRGRFCHFPAPLEEMKRLTGGRGKKPTANLRVRMLPWRYLVFKHLCFSPQNTTIQLETSNPKLLQHKPSRIKKKVMAIVREKKNVVRTSHLHNGVCDICRLRNPVRMFFASPLVRLCVCDFLEMQNNEITSLIPLSGSDPFLCSLFQD